MKDISSQLEILSEFVDADSAFDLSQLQAALGGASRATVFRYLARLPYRRSYNHNGRYYTRHDPSCYDRFGLRVIADVRFSRDGSLKATVRRLVRESEPGCTQRELEQLLRVRVQSVLLAAVEQGGLVRQRVDGIYVYFHPKRVARRAQLRRRQEQCAAGVATAAYFFNAFLPLSDGLAGYARWSPFYYYLTSDPLNDGVHWGHVGVLSALCAGLFLLAVLLFERRDLRQVG